MRVEPKTEQQLREIEESNLLPDGVYDFEVVSALDKHSAKGNEMVELKLRIEESPLLVMDYLVAIDSMAYKIKNFAKSVGLLAEYESGNMPAEQMVGCTGKAKIKTQPAKGDYRAKNAVADYVETLSTKPPATRAELDALLDDDLPF